MADYYSILAKTISGLNSNTPDLRQSVYEKARKAIEGQLRNLDPKPGEEAIQSQLKLLEEAIVVIELENAAKDQPAAEPEPEIDPVSELAAMISSPPEPEATASIASESASLSANAEPSIDTSLENTQADLQENSEPVFGAPSDGVSAETDVPPQVESDGPQGVTNEPTEGGIPPELVEQADSSEKSGFTSAIITLVVLALLGTGAFAMWLNRDLIANTFSSFTESEETKPVTVATNEDESAPEPEESVPNIPEPTTEDKESVRLADNGQEEPVEPEAPENNETAETETPVVIEQPEPEATETPEPEDAVEPAEGEEATNSFQNDDDDASSNASPLGEVAYLYEEGSAGSGATRSNARVNWSLVNVKPTEALPAEPVIMGTMEVPEKGLGVVINIKRNVDDSLSASHIIEMTFEIPEGFTGGSIENIARFVMKPSEEARGEPLVAVPVKVSDGFFLIALDNLEQAVQVNQQLILNSGWIDIPISYATGKRALLTLEKGGSGDQIFKQAFADWQNR